MKVLENVSESTWQDREKHWIDKFADSVTNGTAGGEGLVNPSQEVRDKISKTLKDSGVSLGNQHHKGIKHTNETKARISAGVKNSESLKQIAARKKGIPLVEMTEAARIACTGVPKSKEHRLKISEAMKSSTGAKQAAENRKGIKLLGASEKKHGSRFINDGKIVKQLKVNEPLPDGWVYGMKIKPGVI